MNIFIRTDASVEIGTGHVMRCITLAKQLVSKGAEVSFICRDFLGNKIAFIQEQGFSVYILPSLIDEGHWNWISEFWKWDAEETRQILREKNADLLIVDHYSIDIKWEKELRSLVKHIMVIDDLANRIHDCDLLLDQNYYRNMHDRYKNLIPNSCMKLLGPNYVLLREDFLSIHIEKLNRHKNLNNILIFFGGTDPTGETIKVLKAIKELALADVEYNVVVGDTNPQKNKVKNLCQQISNVKFHCQISNMAELMVKAVLAIGAGGTTSWERCYLGLPTLLIIVADNQKEVAHAINERRVVYCLGESKEVAYNIIREKIYEMYKNPAIIKEMAGNCWEVINPYKVKEKLVVKEIVELMK